MTSAENGTPRKDSPRPHFDELMEAMLEVARSKGYEVGAVMLLRPSRSRDTHEFIFLTNSGAGLGIQRAAVAALEMLGFPAEACEWAKQ